MCGRQLGQFLCFVLKLSIHFVFSLQTSRRKTAHPAANGRNRILTFDEVEWLAAYEEEDKFIAQYSPTDEEGNIISDRILVR